MHMPILSKMKSDSDTLIFDLLVKYQEHVRRNLSNFEMQVQYVPDISCHEMVNVTTKAHVVYLFLI